MSHEESTNILRCVIFFVTFCSRNTVEFTVFTMMWCLEDSRGAAIRTESIKRDSAPFRQMCCREYDAPAQVRHFVLVFFVGHKEEHNRLCLSFPD